MILYILWLCDEGDTIIRHSVHHTTASAIAQAAMLGRRVARVQPVQQPSR